MKLSVIGCGRWGTFLAWYLERSGSEVTLYGRKGSKRMEQLLSTRSNGVTTLPPSVHLTQDLPTALHAQHQAELPRCAGGDLPQQPPQALGAH